MKRIVPLAVVLAFAAGACSNNSSTSTATTPTSPTSTTTTETFSGTVAVQGSDTHNFSVNQLGTVSVTLSSAAPPADVVMGVGIGVASGGACNLVPGATQNTAAGAAAQLSGTVSVGTLCVQVYDIGNATGPVSYTVSVSHP